MAYSEMSYAEVSQDPDEEVPFVPRKRSLPRFLGGHRVGRLGSTGLFFGTAVASGLFCYILFTIVFGVGHPPPWPRPLPLPDTASLASAGGVPNAQSAPPPIGLPPSYTHVRPEIPDVAYHELSLEEMTEMVERTKGYFVRDWSLALGWNNMRYIIEAAHTQARALNRTLVLPSFVYARACEYELTACADYADMVNKGEAIGSDQWKDLPYELQMGFKIPIQYMLNVTRLRDKHPVLTTAQYLRLHNLPPEAEASNGAWQREAYHVHAAALAEDQAQRPSLFVIENHWYDPWQATRVDRIPDDVKARGGWVPTGGDPGLGERGSWPQAQLTPISEKLFTGLGERSMTLEWDRAVELLRETDAGRTWDITSDEGITKAFQDNSWEVLYTFKSVLGMEFTRSVVEPVRQVVPRTSLRGWADEYVGLEEDVVLLVGEVHLSRKPGGFRFSTPEARIDLEDLVLHYVVPVDAMYALADELAMRMRALVGGRLWMGSHMRRGDFVKEGWVMEKSPQDHVDRVKERLAKGREILASLREIQPYPLPGVVANAEQLTLEPPQPDDKFYIATDERNPEALEIIAANGAIFLDDLLTMADRRLFGWPLMFTDLRAILEQSLLAHSAYFYAHAMSSVAGGIVNMRAAFGADPRTVLID